MAQITLRDYFQETEGAISSNRIDDALTRCQHMLSSFPEALEVQRLLGEVYFAQGRLEEAQQLFDWVLTNDPENVVAYCNRARLSEQMSEYDIALDCYQQAYELKRGQGQLREEFNRLSERVGQKGFMYSRAGLARLYMRGDLLSQASQEWDAVLAATPDRLDARLGQLETYWRLGLQEKVEQLAEQILRDVPGCLKALLLHASVVSSRDSQRSQELLLSAEALDPDYVIARELFADVFVSRPDDPFLQRLKGAPVLLPVADLVKNAQELQLTPLAAVSDPVNALPIANGTALQTSWNAPLQEVKDAPSSQETHLRSKEYSLEPWELLQNALNQFDTSGANPTIEASPTIGASPMATGGMLGSAELSQPVSDVPQSLVSRQQEIVSLSGIEAGLWSTPTEEPIPPANENSLSSSPSWLNMLAQSDVAARRNDSSDLTLESHSDNRQPLADASLEQIVQSNTTSSEASSLPLTIGAGPMATEKAESHPSWFETADVGNKSEDDGESFFGPAWLKSLGATMAEEESPAIAADAEIQHVAQPEYTDPQREEHSHAAMQRHSAEPLQVPSAEYTETPSVRSNDSVSEATPYELWTQASLNNSPNIPAHPSRVSADFSQQSQDTKYEAEPSPENAFASSTPSLFSSVDLPAEQPVRWEAVDEKAEQNLMTTLEELEQSLRSKGFIPLEPNSLSVLAAAQTQESSVSSHDLDTLKTSEEYNAQNVQQPASGEESQEMHSAPSLSFALAQLGSFVKEPLPSEVSSPPSSLEVVGQHEESSWLHALSNMPATPAVPATPTLPPGPSASAGPADNLPVAYGLAPHEPAPTYERLVPHEPPVTAIPSEQIRPVAKELQQTAEAPAMRGNPLFDVDGELEATMKRPAVRLQPMPRPPSLSQREGLSRSQSGERMQKAARGTQPTNENLSYRDRLVKGYQYQLVGDYEEAMQEYRLIIRNATDLIGEVISNVSALLKLSPNYSAGYRVLGDAYMRQGEYLQAMEAYNKALTMTKKVRSQA